MNPETSQNSASESDCCQSAPSQTRRTVLAAAGVLGAAGFLVACSSGSGDSAAKPQNSASGSPDANTDIPDGDAVLASTADVAVGGATFVQSRGIVVSQPTEGEFHAFQATCPHQGCMVTETQDTDLLCPCHASLFSGKTGAVLRGPATSGLPEIDITVDGNRIVQA
jgi:Rieske Fe-S protein